MKMYDYRVVVNTSESTGDEIIISTHRLLRCAIARASHEWRQRQNVTGPEGEVEVQDWTGTRYWEGRLTPPHTIWSKEA